MDSSLGTARIITHRVRRLLPAAAANAAKGLIHAFGVATAGARLLPSFLIIGGQRCGTTTLFRILTQHPSVVRPTVTKGTGYFEKNHHRGERWYRAHFPIRRIGRVTFESSGYYSFHPLAPERIASDLPDVKIVMMVRDPAERAFSAYKHEFARGYETEPFERALELEPERLAGEVERMRAEPGYESVSHRHHAYVTRGQYADQLLRFEMALGMERLHVIDADRFFADPAVESTRLSEFLGLPAWAPETVERWNARPSAPMPRDVRNRLYDYFAPYDGALERYLGGLPSWRLADRRP